MEVWAGAQLETAFWYASFVYAKRAQGGGEAEAESWRNTRVRWGGFSIRPGPTWSVQVGTVIEYQSLSRVRFIKVRWALAGTFFNELDSCNLGWCTHTFGKGGPFHLGGSFLFPFMRGRHMASFLTFLWRSVKCCPLCRWQKIGEISSIIIIFSRAKLFNTVKFILTARERLFFLIK